MEPAKKIGIWMDYHTAHVMEFSERPKEIDTIVSKLSGNVKAKGENYLHSKERHLRADYFKKIANVILKYDKALLFGPTYAKTELLNIVSADPRFFQIKVHLKETGKMTLIQRNEFIYEFFSSPLLR